MEINELKELKEIVDEINYRIVDKLGGDFGGDDELGLYPRLVLSYVAEFGWYIDLDDVNIWREYEDPRRCTEDGEYEELKPFLLGQIRLVSRTYRKLESI